MLVCSFKVTLKKRIVCQSRNKMDYILSQTVPSKATFTKVTTYKQ